jgi:hypothetical protein
MKRGPAFSAVPLAAIALFLLAGCSKDEAPVPAAPAAPSAAAPAKPKAPTPVNEADLPKIPILPGYKYYIGGPMLMADKWGKYRISKFNGEVAQPPSRGIVFGAKQDGDKLEYKVWANGRIVGFHKGTMREGVYWDEYVEGFKNGAVVARENITHDDNAKKSKVITEDIDGETGEVIRTREKFLSYFPPKDDPSMEDEDGEDAGTAGTAATDAPPTPAAPAPGAAAAPAAPAAGSAPPKAP